MCPRWFEIALRSKADGILLFQPKGIDSSAMCAGSGQRSHIFLLSRLAMDAPQGLDSFGRDRRFRQSGQGGGHARAGPLGSAARIGIILSSGYLLGYASTKTVLSGRGGDAELTALALSSSTAGALKRRASSAARTPARACLTEHPDINAILCIDAKATIGAGPGYHRPRQVSEGSGRGFGADRDQMELTR
jgi:hypothetical protein